MQVERINSDALAVDKLPDGSMLIVDPENEKVFALNPTAGAAWDACGAATTLSGVTTSMQCSFSQGVTEELAEKAILQLQEQKLVKTSGSSSRATRREFITTLSAMALPLVVSLTMADQRAYAKKTGSKPDKDPSKPND